MLVLLILLKGCVTCEYLTAYGNFGRKFLKRNYAVMQNVSWADAFDRCTKQINSGQLFNRPSVGMATHLQHDRSVLRQNGWQNVDIWFGIMKRDNTTWLAATQDNCEDVISDSVMNKLPPLTPGFSQCLLLNMSGSGDNDIYYAASCEELHPFLCQSQVYIGTVESTLYNEMMVKLDLLEFFPKVIKIDVNKEDDCQVEIDNNPRAFAAVYFPSQNECEVYVQNPTVIYPVRVQMENHSNVTSFVKTKGHEVVAISGNSSYDGIPVKNSQKCFNYGISPQASSTQEMAFVSGGHTINMSKTTDAPSNIYTYTGNVVSDDTQNSDLEAATNILNMTNTTVVPVSTENMGTPSEILDCVWVCKDSTTSQGIHISLSDLRIDKTTLSSYRRRYISVSDHRLSATVIGWSGATILIILIVVIIIPDFVLIGKNIKHHFNNSKSYTFTT